MGKEKEIDSSFLEIDMDSLDEEWINQPELFHKYAIKASLYSKKHDEAKAELDVVKAEAGKRIRQNPQKYGIKKVSEKAIEEAIILDHSYQEALEALHSAKYKWDIARDAVRALDQRCKALENEVKLHGQNYFSTPQADETSREAVNDIERKAIRRRQVMKRRRDDDDEEDE